MSSLETVQFAEVRFATIRFVSDALDLWFIPVAALAMLLTLTAVVRMAGVRSLSKMMSFDFAVTVSLGSVLASIVTLSTPLLNGMLAVAALLAMQALLSWIRRRSGSARRAADNAPVLLMDGAGLIEQHLRQVRMTPHDVYAQVRMAGISSVDEVGAVILETTGDVSVLTTPDIDPELLAGVRGRTGPR